MGHASRTFGTSRIYPSFTATSRVEPSAVSTTTEPPHVGLWNFSRALLFEGMTTTNSASSNPVPPLDPVMEASGDGHASDVDKVGLVDFVESIRADAAVITLPSSNKNGVPGGDLTDWTWDVIHTAVVVACVILFILLVFIMFSCFWYHRRFRRRRRANFLTSPPPSYNKARERIFSSFAAQDHERRRAELEDTVTMMGGGKRSASPDSAIVDGEDIPMSLFRDMQLGQDEKSFKDRENNNNDVMVTDIDAVEDPQELLPPDATERGFQWHDDDRAAGGTSGKLAQKSHHRTSHSFVVNNKYQPKVRVFPRRLGPAIKGNLTHPIPLNFYEYHRSGGSGRTAHLSKQPGGGGGPADLSMSRINHPHHITHHGQTGPIPRYSSRRRTSDGSHTTTADLKSAHELSRRRMQSVPVTRHTCACQLSTVPAAKGSRVSSRRPSGMMTSFRRPKLPKFNLAGEPIVTSSEQSSVSCVTFF